MNDSERDALLVRLDVNVQTLLESHRDHEHRLASLEHSRTKQSGVIIAVSAVVSAGWAAVLVFLGVYWSR